MDSAAVRTCRLSSGPKHRFLESSQILQTRLEERLRLRLTRKRSRSGCSRPQDRVWPLNQDGGRVSGRITGDSSEDILVDVFPLFSKHTRRSYAKIFGSDRFHIDPPLCQDRSESASPDLSRPKFISQERTQETTKAFPPSSYQPLFTAVLQMQQISCHISSAVRAGEP